MNDRGIDDHPLTPLRAAINNADTSILNNGRLLPERELAAHFNVGRRRIREALATLEREGIVFRKQGQGTFIEATMPKVHRLVSLSNRSSPQEIVEVRMEFEPILARLAALRATPVDIEAMKRLVMHGSTAETVKQYDRWDYAFHAKIAESVRNTIFWGIFELIGTVRSEQAWLEARERTFTVDTLHRLVGQHKSIISFIERREPDMAEAAMREHIATVSHVVLSSDLHFGQTGYAANKST